jgi:hypothetical protein
VPGVIRITIAAKGRYFFSQKSATVKIVHWGRLGIDLGHVVSREFFNSLPCTSGCCGSCPSSPSDKKIALASVFRLQSS